MAELTKEFIILDILTRNDPFGLIEEGAPDDEYLPEVEDIMSVIEKCSSVDELNQHLIRIFEHWFCTLTDDEVGQEQKMKIRLCSIDIWEKCQN